MKTRLKYSCWYYFVSIARKWPLCMTSSANQDSRIHYVVQYLDEMFLTHIPYLLVWAPPRLSAAPEWAPHLRSNFFKERRPRKSAALIDFPAITSFKATNLRLLMSRRHIQQWLRCSSWTRIMKRTVHLPFDWSMLTYYCSWYIYYF